MICLEKLLDDAQENQLDSIYMIFILKNIEKGVFYGC